MSRTEVTGDYTLNGMDSVRIYVHHYSSVTMTATLVEGGYGAKIAEIARNHKLPLNSEYADKQAVPDGIYISSDQKFLKICGVGKQVQAAMTEVADLIANDKERSEFKGLVKDLFGRDDMRQRREEAEKKPYEFRKAASNIVAVLSSLHQIGHEGAAADSFVRWLTQDRLVGIRGGREQ